MSRLGRAGFRGAVISSLFLGASVFAQGTSPDVEIGFRKGSQLSAEDQLSQAAQYEEKMKATLGQVIRLANKARSDKDIIKLNCVNDKLIQVKGHLRLGETSNTNLKNAAARQDAGTRNHEFAKLTITYQRIIVLGQEAEACIGEEIAYVGATKVEVQVDPDIPQEDPTTQPRPQLPVERPPLASPFF